MSSALVLMPRAADSVNERRIMTVTFLQEGVCMCAEKRCLTPFRFAQFCSSAEYLKNDADLRNTEVI